jgi:hypothetical protein
MARVCTIFVFRVWLVLSVVLVVASSGGAQTAGNWTKNDAGQVIVTHWALQHIMQRHWPGSTATGAGKFQEGITESSLRDMINEAVRSGRARPNTHGRSGTIYEYDFQHQIGTTIDGGPATHLRVVVSNRNEVITAFPF